MIVLKTTCSESLVTLCLFCILICFQLSWLVSLYLKFLMFVQPRARPWFELFIQGDHTHPKVLWLSLTHLHLQSRFLKREGIWD